MITLAKAIELSGMSLGQVEKKIGVSKTTLSRVANNDYPELEQKTREIIEKMVVARLITSEQSELTVVEIPSGALVLDTNAFIRTANVARLDALAGDLLNPTTTLNASIGIVTGNAGYGKTTALQHFCATNPNATYILYLEGYTVVSMMREILRSITGEVRRSFDSIRDGLRDATIVYRRLVVIDEADRLPMRLLEALRTMNEYCGLPFLLVGEPALLQTMEGIPRLKSRMRKPLVSFAPLNINDVRMFYSQALGIDLTGRADIQMVLLKRCALDFRVLVNDAQHIVRVMNANKLTELSMEVLNGIGV